jgi:hypothetical protein
MRSIASPPRRRRSARGGNCGRCWAVLGLQAVRERALLRPAAEPSGYLFRAARAIDARLREDGAAVPAYVFGHTHVAEQYPLSDRDDAPWYLNSGTWTPILQQAFDLFGDRERLTFVRVERNTEDGHVHAELLLWNDNAARPEPVRAIADRPWPVSPPAAKERSPAAPSRPQGSKAVDER